MLGKSKDQRQIDIFDPLLNDFIDQKHELVLLATKIDWNYFEKEFASPYPNVGQKSMHL